MNRSIRFIVVVGLVAGCAAIPRAVGQTIIYVNASATGANDGSSWINGYTDLIDGLNAATPLNMPRDQVWVAAGEYKVMTTNDTFLLKAGVWVFGGFSGTGSEGTTPISDTFDPRQFDADGYLVYETILSGELGDPDDFSDNVEVLVTAAANDEDFIFDGFTVTRASGHGVYVPEFSNGLFRNLRILDNRAVEFDGLGDYDMGAGMFVVGCSPTIFRCRYEDNYLLPTGGAQGGGAGLGIHAATAWVEGCSFSGNVTEALPFDSVEGGGALQARKSSLTLLHSEFRENSCIEGNGGAVALILCDTNPVIAACAMSGNSVVTECGGFTHGGGGAV